MLTRAAPLNLRDGGASTWAFRQPSRDDVAMRRFYEPGKSLQWRAEDVDWSQPGSLADATAARLRTMAEAGTLARFGSLFGEPMARWALDDWIAFERELVLWRLSQFLHGEQLALVTAAKVVRTGPDAATKMAAAVQVADEGRHVDVFSRYLATECDRPYEPEDGLASLLALLVAEPRWDVASLVLQAVLEGSALESYRTMSDIPQPLLRDVLTRVIGDERRHVGGAAALQPFLLELSSAERSEREDVLIDAVRAVRTHLRPVAVCERFDVPVDRYERLVSFVERRDPRSLSRRIERRLVRNLVRIGLVDHERAAAVSQRIRGR